MVAQRKVKETGIKAKGKKERKVHQEV